MASSNGRASDGGAGPEDDYMSEAWLERLQQAEQASAGRKRKPAAPCKDADVDAEGVPLGTLKLRERMARRLQQGLEQPIPASNIGHKLLAKMGYKAGRLQQALLVHSRLTAAPQCSAWPRPGAQGSGASATCRHSSERR